MHRRHVEHRPTKEKFFVSTYYVNKIARTFSALGGFSGPFVNWVDDKGYVNCLVPWDFDKLSAISLVFIARASENPMYMNIVTNYAKAGEAYTEHGENVSLSINTVANRIQELNIYDAVDVRTLEARDYLGVYANRNDTLPTQNTSLILLGIRLRYLYR